MARFTVIKFGSRGVFPLVTEQGCDVCDVCNAESKLDQDLANRLMIKALREGVKVKFCEQDGRTFAQFPAGFTL